jgi:hypothetical protein
MTTAPSLGEVKYSKQRCIVDHNFPDNFEAFVLQYGLVRGMTSVMHGQSLGFAGHLENSIGVGALPFPAPEEEFSGGSDQSLVMFRHAVVVSVSLDAFCVMR